jgi:AcrR family transcriptional regulator
MRDVPKKKRRRASGPEAKTARRKQILDAASTLFDTHPYRSVTMAAIAREAGLAKGTTYIYFKTKEGLFLEVITEEVDRWYSDLNRAMHAVQPPVGPPAMAEILAESLSARPSMLRLLSLLHGVLEQNISLEMALKYKRLLRAHLLSCGERFEVLMPHLKPGDGARLLQHLQACVVGYFQATTPPPAVALAFQEKDLTMFKMDFYTELRYAITMVLTGVETTAHKAENRD